MLVHIIADYGPAGDLAFAEVVQRIKLHLPDAEPVLTPVPPFATLAAGFCIAQLGLNDAPAGTIIYHNVAPRQDVEEAREANAGERLAFARLPTRVRVIGVNAGHTFSFVRDAAEELRWAAVPAAGSQFRSRDLFPQAAAAIALGHPDALAETINLNQVYFEIRSFSTSGSSCIFSASRSAKAMGSWLIVSWKSATLVSRPSRLAWQFW